MKPSKFELSIYRGFNKYARVYVILLICFCLPALFLLILDIVSSGTLVKAENNFSGDVYVKIIFLFFILLLLICGLLFLKAKEYYPPHIKKWKEQERRNKVYNNSLLMPLYCVVYDQDPASRASEIAQHFSKRDDLDLDLLEQHITEELNNPKQQVSELHNFTYANESQLREFLEKFLKALKDKRNV